MGERGRLGLPQAAALKKIMFSKFPRYGDDPEKFEPLWEKCVIALMELAEGSNEKARTTGSTNNYVDFTCIYQNSLML